LHEGGWTVEYSLGQINASPEFSFPLQLIYRNNREQAGMFGSQWWCPQLESTVLPRGRGVLVWTMPSGGMVGFKEDGRRAGDFRSFDGNWRARMSANRVNIINAEGWQYAYSRGRLDSVTSPTGRVLEFSWAGDRFQGIQLRDVSSGTRLVLAQATYGENRRLGALEITGQPPQRFAYAKEGREERLVGWAPPVGRPVSFVYHPESKVLTRTVLGDGKDPADVAEFKTDFVPPFEGDKPKKDPDAKRNPANWWLVGDPQFDYAYARKGKNGEQWLSDQITITGRTGIKQEIGFAANRGIVTAKPEAGPERKTYFYRAPGQRYDGKLRRIEEGGKLLVEYRYDRRTGLMTEMHDANGVITFFDYDPNWRPRGREFFEPKPIRVRRGTRRAWEVVGEFAYDDQGRLTAAKDIAGAITRYTYTNRGELASVTDPEGGATSFLYDQLGRRTAVMRNGLTERVEYDPLGRVRAQVAADGTRTEFAFDKQGQIEAIKQNGETSIEYVRNELGQVVGEKDPLGRMRQVERDARGNLLAEHAPNGSVTRYEYDEFNRRIAQIDGIGNKITFAYDPMGRLIKQANPLGGTLTWKYDDKGRLIERTNGEQTIRHTHDKDGRLTLLDYGNGQLIEYTHDKEGRVLTATTPETAFEYAYDKLGRVVSTTVRQGDEEMVLRYTHNARGQRTSLTLSRVIPAVPSTGGRAGKHAGLEILQQTHYAYDAAGRLVSIVSNGHPAVTYSYDNAGRVIQKLYGGDKPDTAEIVANIGYDARSRLGRIEFTGSSLGSPKLLAYEWDPASQLTRRSWNGETQCYEYDPSGQLLKVLDDKTAEALESYRYDLAGNMIEKIVGTQRTAKTYNAANQLVKMYDLPSTMDDVGDQAAGAAGDFEKLAREVLAYSYDKAGRMLGVDGRGSSTYGWLDKVTELTQPDGSRVTFTYWPDGQLASKKVPSASERDDIRHIVNRPSSIVNDTFLWDGLALLKRNETVYIIEPHPSGGIPVASHPLGRPDQITWHLNDLLGTTLATVQNGRSQFARLSAFGQPLKLATNVPKSTSALNDTGLTNPFIPETQTIQRTQLNP
jgi:YD repeat-containing protein